MKRSIYRFAALTFIVLASCGGPDALVINTVNRDGSVDRKIILTWDKDEFDLNECQVPVDSTWNITKIMEVSEKGDTTWTLTAQKRFESVDQINVDYTSYGGPNSKLTREAGFVKKFKWFNTSYYFEEKIEKAIEGYPLSDFFTPDEIELFHMPVSMSDALASGPDSTRVKASLQLIEEKKDKWLSASLFKASCIEFEYFNDKVPGNKVDIEVLRTKEQEFIDLIIADFDGDEQELVDTILGKGYYDSHRAVIDTSFSMIEQKFNVSLDTKAYQVQTIMPGDLVATNGYIDSDSNILWKIDGDSFVTEDYVMWAESTIINRWAWIVSGLFIIFVITGFLIKNLRRRVG